MAASLLAVLWHFYPRWRWLYAIFAAALMLSLVAARDHFLSDVIAGALIGVAIGAAAAFLAGRVTGSTPAGSTLWR
jgi:membrane-associated phospholipid phosphatase